MTETDKKIARLYSKLAEAYRIINNLEKENKKNTKRYAGKSYEEAKSKQDIAKIVDELYETANDDQKCILCELYQRIIRLPSVQPKAKVGHWIMDDTEHGHCSICKHKEDLMDGKSSYGWCSNCGARMVEE